MYALVVVSLALSLGGVAVAACFTTNPADGGRGGALAVAVTLAAFFLRKDINSQLRIAFTETLPELESEIQRLSDPLNNEHDPKSVAQQIAALQRIVTSMETSSRLNAMSELRMNRFVAAAAAIGNLFWAFGDIAARWLLP